MMVTISIKNRKSKLKNQKSKIATTTQQSTLAPAEQTAPQQ